MKKEKFLVCIADRLTPKMRNSLKLEVKKHELDDIKGYCREKHLDFDIIPINATNFGRIAVVMNQVKSINYETTKQQYIVNDENPHKYRTIINKL